MSALASGKGEENGYQYCMLMNGSDEHVRKMLGMRNDILFYSEFLDHYAPAVVGNLTWNDDAKMNAHCCTTDLRTFAKHILSVSDEAFIILVLVNAARRWMYEISRDKSMVRTRRKHIVSTLIQPTICKFSYIFVNMHAMTTGGWNMDRG